MTFVFVGRRASQSPVPTLLAPITPDRKKYALNRNGLRRSGIQLAPFQETDMGPIATEYIEEVDVTDDVY